MKENVFSREKDDGSVEVTCTLTDPPIVVSAPTQSMATDELIRQLHRNGIYNLTVVESQP